MPEGDTIYMSAERLRPVLVDQVITEALSRWPGVVRSLVGSTVVAVEPVGKHLLLEVDDGTTLRVHLGMKGRWVVSSSDAPLRGSLGDVSIHLGTARWRARCTKAPTVERFRTRERPVHPVLRRLGPDVLGVGFSAREAAERVREGGAASASAAEVLLDQSMACGIGNVYKSELLFLQRIHPFTPPGALSGEQWEALYARARRLMTANLHERPRNTTGLGPGQPRHWVYGRQRRGCLRCRTRIEIARQGRDLPRITTWCPRCQPA